MTENHLCLSPLKIDHQTAINRLAVHPVETNTAEEKGKPSKATIQRYSSLAEGQWGILCVECTSVMDAERPDHPQLVLNHETVDDFKTLVEIMKQIQPDTLVFIQLSHNGPQIKPETGRRCSPAPTQDEHTRLMTKEEIQYTRDSLIEAAKLAQHAGFDGVDVKQCPGFFGGEILAPRNIRQDEYGGNFENRSRFFREVSDGIKQEAEDLLLMSRIFIYEGSTGGIGTKGPKETDFDLDEPTKMLHLLNDYGYHIVSVTGKPFPEWAYEYSTHPQNDYELHPMMRLAGWVKDQLQNSPLKVLNVKNSSMGSDWSYVAEYCLKNEHTDFIGFGRQTLADPWTPKKFIEGKPIQDCKQVEGCMQKFIEGEPVTCVAYYPNL